MKTWKHNLWVVIGLALCVGVIGLADVWGRPNTRNYVQGERVKELRKGWHVFAYDDDLDATAELIAEPDAFANLAATDTIEIVSAQAADTCVVEVVGYKADSTRYVSRVTVNGTTGGKTADTFYAFEYARIDSGGEMTGALTIRRDTGDTFISTVLVGHLQDYAAIKLGGMKTTRGSAITTWTVGVTDSTGSINAELRIYDDYTDIRDMTDGYRIADRIFIGADLKSETRVYPQPIHIPRFGFAAVYATGGVANSDAYTVMQGYDF